MMNNLVEYIEFDKGNLPLIISVPHGGVLECEDIPERRHGILGIDRGTIELSKDLIRLIYIIYEKKTFEGKSPSFIVSKVQRKNIDLNREENEAYIQSSVFAKDIYHFYHNTIQKLIYYNLENFGRSLLIDIHGFEKNNRPSGFRDVEMILGTNNLKSLFSNHIQKKDWGKNIRGKIINKFLNLEIPIAPGHPKRKEYVLSGGYTIQQYGASQFNSNSQAIQVELSDRIRLYDQELRKIVVNSLVNIFFENLMDFL